MKLVRFEAGGALLYGTLKGDEIRVLPGDPFALFLETGGIPKEPGSIFRLTEARLLPPVNPPNIIAIGLNYRGHAREIKQPFPKAPVIFSKTTNSLIGPDDRIVLPPMAPDEVDYEAELAVVIGKTAKDVPEERALDFALGYTCANDVSARNCQLREDVQWTRGKSFDTFCPLGPWVETEIDPDRVPISLRLNGAVLQDSNTGDMIFSCSALVSYLSRCMTLLPGTVILTGTPEGVGFTRHPPVFLRDGDVVEVEIGDIGVLRNLVVKG